MLSALFPGQGSQTVGMGKLMCDAFREARDVFQEVDDALSLALSKIIFEGPEEELTKTVNTQPALMATSIAVLRVLEKQSGQKLSDHCKYVAGHSLGEYTALCAAGALSLSDTAKLLRIRGQAMQEAVPAGKGGMVALVGVEFEKAQEIARAVSVDGESAQAANDNGGGQVVLSGTMNAVDAVVARAAEFGVKRAIKLAVSAPFHSSLMQPAAKVMKDALEKVEVKSPTVPLIANVTANIVTDPNEIRSLLVEQVTGTVRWRESVMKLEALGVTKAVEIGSGKVLAGLVKRISSNISTTSIHTPEELEKWLEQGVSG